jgi:hypothetical protein
MPMTYLVIRGPRSMPKVDLIYSKGFWPHNFSFISSLTLPRWFPNVFASFCILHSSSKFFSFLLLPHSPFLLLIDRDTSIHPILPHFMSHPSPKGHFHIRFFKGSDNIFFALHLVGVFPFGAIEVISGEGFSFLNFRGGHFSLSFCTLQ